MVPKSSVPGFGMYVFLSDFLVEWYFLKVTLKDN